MAAQVTLGAHTYEVRPQKIGYLIHKLGPNLQAILEAEIDGLGGAELAGAKAHGVLSVFIPDLMPLHEFLGYVSEEAMTAGHYDEEGDPSPLEPEIEEAFRVASDANGGKVLKALKAAMGPKIWEKAIAFATAKLAEENGPLSAPLASSPTSQPASGESDPTSSGTTPPTTTEPASAG